MAVLWNLITWLMLGSLQPQQRKRHWINFQNRRIQPLLQSADGPLVRTLSFGAGGYSPADHVGEVTAHILEFNNSARLHEREEMIRFAKYPSEAASALIAR